MHASACHWQQRRLQHVQQLLCFIHYSAKDPYFVAQLLGTAIQGINIAIERAVRCPVKCCI
jgi:hypothetical protein